MRLILILIVCLSSNLLNAQREVYLCKGGEVYFKSDAPLELIEARSSNLRGAIDVKKRQFAFSIKTKTFEGFNSALQQVHFNENYVESKQYPSATFTGKIIEKIDFEKDGEYDIRAKGELNIHGIEQERIIKSKLIIKDDSIDINAEFSVLLEEHDIRIPKIVNQKISEVIFVRIDAHFEKPGA